MAQDTPDNTDNRVPEDVTVHWLAEQLEAQAPLFLLDVREPWEYEQARIRDSFGIPMAEIPSRTADLPRDKTIVVICRVGGRSAQVTGWLRSQGFENATNLQGGTNAWATHIDPEMKTY
ncbi:MAG: rhodanese-like domain-containing protein [Pseudomonadota bacterium]